MFCLLLQKILNPLMSVWPEICLGPPRTVETVALDGDDEEEEGNGDDEDSAGYWDDGDDSAGYWDSPFPDF